MSNIGFIGLGKLGLPSALAIESKGHTVVGYDLNPNVKQYIERKTIPYLEQSVPELLQKTKIEVLSLAEVLSWYYRYFEYNLPKVIFSVKIIQR